MADSVSYLPFFTSRTNINANPSPDSTSTSPFRKMYSDPQGVFHLGDDGVLRSFSGPPERIVHDAIGLSPAQIKKMLDQRPWNKETEDKFRGVDGRKVVDHDQLFEPPDRNRPPRYTKEEFEAERKRCEELNREMRERVEREREEGVDVAEKYACGRKQADYDLSPRVE